MISAKDILHLYNGCTFRFTNEAGYVVIGILDGRPSWQCGDALNYTPRPEDRWPPFFEIDPQTEIGKWEIVLRHINYITNSHMVEFRSLGGYIKDGKPIGTPESILFLINNKYDCFGLFESGQAIHENAFDLSKEPDYRSAPKTKEQLAREFCMTRNMALLARKLNVNYQQLVIYLKSGRPRIGRAKDFSIPEKVMKFYEEQNKAAPQSL